MAGAAAAGERGWGGAGEEEEAQRGAQPAQEGLAVQYKTGTYSPYRRALSRGKPESDLGFQSSLWLPYREGCRAGGGDAVGIMLALLPWGQ